MTSCSDVTLIDAYEQGLGGSSGAATAAIARITGTVRVGPHVRPFSLVRKSFQPLSTGPHKAGGNDPGHWAYWRRELLAYDSGLLPDGPGLTAPRCFGAVDDTVYLEDVVGEKESVSIAAERLGRWQSTDDRPNVGWLAGHQLAQRIAATDLDWTTVEPRPASESVWARRHDFLDELRAVPTVLSHGDFHLGNLVARDTSTVVLDWGTLGIAPVGADLAHLALSTLTDVVAEYLAGLGGGFDEAAVRTGYRVTLALVAASRVHWMCSHGIELPDDYEAFAFDAAGGVTR